MQITSLSVIAVKKTIIRKVLFLAVSPRKWSILLAVTPSFGLCVIKCCFSLVACVPGYPGCMVKRWSRTGTALLSSVTKVQQGFMVRSHNIGTRNEVPVGQVE